MRQVMMALAMLAAAGAARADGAFITADKRDITEPTQKALIVCSGGVEDLVLQVRFSGETSGFAWLAPTPSRPQVGQASDRLFYDLAVFTKPVVRKGLPLPGNGAFGGFGGGVALLERRTVGVYDVSVLDAADPRALVAWLDHNGYPVSPRISGVLKEYIRRGWFFTAMRIDPAKMRDAADDATEEEQRREAERAEKTEAKTASQLHNGTLQPLRLTFRANFPVYPLHISSLNGGKTDLLLYALTDGPVGATGFHVEYAQPVAASKLNDLTHGLPTITHPMWLTKLTRKMPTASMSQDVYLSVRRP